MRQEPSRRRFLAGVGAVCAGTAAATTSAGRPDDATGSDADTVEAVPAVTSQDGGLAETVADLVETSLDEYDLAGASVAVVADGSVELAEGFGVADREDGREATVDTPFRIGSVSKAVTWTALMRRIQRGDLAPDTDVSTVVDVPVPDSKGPVTLADLATHRAGLEDGNSQLWIQDADDVASLPAHLRRATISQVREPGEAGSYSNYGAALGGQALAAARGDPFETAVEEELLAPAGMGSSTFRQPLPDSVAADHATGYAPGSTYRSGEFPFVGLRPAGAMSTTAADMARFLQLHVNDGVVDGERVLATGTVEALHRQWATHHEALSGMAFGLVEEYRGDARLLWHNGATLSFTSDMVLIPERGLGLFVSYNESGANSALSDVVEGFLEESLGEAATDGGGGSGGTTDGGNDTGSGGGSGADDGSEAGDGSGSGDTPDEPVPTPTGDPARADALAGTYRSIRRSETGHDRVTTTLQAPTVEVGVQEDGTLTTSRGSVVHRWVEVEPLVFEHVDEDRRLAFLTDGEGVEGSVEYLCFDGSVSAFAPVEGIDRLSLHALLVGVTMLAMASAVVGWPAAAAVRWYRRDDAAILPSRERLRTDPGAQARWVAGGAIAAFAGFLLLVVGHFVVTPLAVLSAPPLTFKLLFALSILGALGALAGVGYAGHVLVRGSWSLVGRLHYALVAASLIGFTWLLAYWNLLLPP